MEKRGLSGVITQILLILLVMVVVGLFLVVIKNVVTKGSEDIELGSFLINLEIKSVKDNSNNAEVRIKRGVGQGEMTGLKISVSDGTDTEIFDQSIAMDELEEKTFTLGYTGIVKEVSVSSMLKRESGGDKIGRVTDTKTFTNKEIIENLGGVSWWKFEGNPNDELKNAHGTLSGGGISCSATGKYGKACEFSGVSGEKIDTNTARSNFFSDTEGTIIAWVKPKGSGSSIVGINELPSVVKDLSNYLGIYIGDPGGGDNIWVYNDDTTSNFQYSQISYTMNDWMHISWVHNTSDIIGYKNGVFVSSMVSGDTTGGGTSNIEIGTSFNGTIDEVMIFNRALTANEVKGLAGLNFG